MKAVFKPSAQLAFEVQAEDVKTIFREIAQIQEVFDAERSCGVCNGTDIRFLARKVDDYDFYELACQSSSCRARFAFGQAKKGGALFPKRKDEDGSYLPNRGWAKWEKPGDGHAAPQSGPPAAKQEKKNGVPVYLTWQDAERSHNWGADWLHVGGKLYKISDSGAYREVPQAGAVK